DEAKELLFHTASLPGLRLDGVYTHFPESDADDLTFSREQLARFRKLIEEVRESGLEIPWIHAANSAAPVRLPESRLDLIRPGILTYGHMPRIDLTPFPGIKPVMSMKAHLVQVRALPA